MLDHRWKFQDRDNLRVLPVIAVGPGPLRLSPVALDRLALVAEALERNPPFAHRIDPLEVWLLDSKANPIEIWHPASEPVPIPKSQTFFAGTRSQSSSFVSQARTAAVVLERVNAVAARECSDGGGLREWKCHSNTPTARTAEAESSWTMHGTRHC